MNPSKGARNGYLWPSDRTQLGSAPSGALPRSIGLSSSPSDAFAVAAASGFGTSRSGSGSASSRFGLAHHGLPPMRRHQRAAAFSTTAASSSLPVAPPPPPEPPPPEPPEPPEPPSYLSAPTHRRYAASCSAARAPHHSSSPSPTPPSVSESAPHPDRQQRQRSVAPTPSPGTRRPWPHVQHSQTSAARSANLGVKPCIPTKRIRPPPWRHGCATHSMGCMLSHEILLYTKTQLLEPGPVPSPDRI